ncbi:MAG: hypothetical protein LBN07_01840 [Christensenellaceae bacterium]|jgi:hypothetical protein|nr:hypothetical protein [Christensenellaceae bacterium]
MLKSTYDIDQANISKMESVSKVAQEQLERFNQTSTEAYNQMRSDLMEVEAPAQTAYELEVYEPEGLPTIINENKQISAVEQTVAFKLNLRGKLIVAITASILALLSILLIYNAISISNYNTQILASQQELVIEQERYNTLMTELEALIDGISPEALGMTQNIPSVGLGGVTVGTTETYSAPTNWFDALCNFIASIFGG